MEYSVAKSGSITNDAVRKAIQDFSGHLAHYLNNILTPLLAYPEMLATKHPADSKALEIIRSIEKTAATAVAVSCRLSDLSGMLRKAQRSVDLAVVVESSLLDVCTNLSAPAIDIQKALTNGILVKTSQDAIVLAMGELCRNGLAAMEDGGTLTVRTERRMLESPLVFSGEIIPAGSYACIEIEDNGVGMSVAELGGVLEPFVKGPKCGDNGGCGLGLSIAYVALREHGAYLTLESTPGRGTLATILIPFETVKRDAAGMLETAIPAALADVFNGDEPRILVVDDEPSIVNLFKLILENYIQGVVVDKAMNGVEALKLFRDKRHDVIVMDLHMPVMDGQSAFLEIESECKRRGWKMPGVVFCTGYAPRDTVKNAVSNGNLHTLLNKPVRSEILVKAVQSRLGAGP